MEINEKRVVVAMSGGVDSSVTAALLSKAIGENLVCVFVDNGLLRKNEAEEVVQTFKNEMDINLFKVDAQKIFLRHLKGIEDPEQKRKIIGRLKGILIQSEKFSLLLYLKQFQNNKMKIQQKKFYIKIKKKIKFNSYKKSWNLNNKNINNKKN